MSVGMDYEGYCRRVDELLTESVKDLCSGLEEVGLIYSAGIDSTLVGVLASEYARVRAYSVGVEDSHDLEHAREADESLPFSVESIEVGITEIEAALPMIVSLVGRPDPLKVSVAVPFYFASKKASEDGFKVMFCGQGADELFGGYNRYLNTLAGEGVEGLKRAMDSDIDTIVEAQLQFDSLVCQGNGVELRFPFMNEELVDCVKSVPSELKVWEVAGEPEYECVDELDGKRYIRKYLLRKIAGKHGLPERIISRRKKAAQYGSGSQKIVERLARRHGFKEKAREEGRKDYMGMYLESLWQ